MGKTQKMLRMLYYFRYMPYLFLALSGFVMGNILIVFHNPDLKKRMAASPVSGRRQSLEGILCMSLAGIALWIFVIVIAIVFFGKDFLYIRKFCILPVEFGIHAFRSDCAGISDGKQLHRTETR